MSVTVVANNHRTHKSQHHTRMTARNHEVTAEYLGPSSSSWCPGSSEDTALNLERRRALDAQFRSRCSFQGDKNKNTPSIRKATFKGAKIVWKVEETSFYRNSCLAGNFASTLRCMVYSCLSIIIGGMYFTRRVLESTFHICVFKNASNLWTCINRYRNHDIFALFGTCNVDISENK